jgi:hypothetical protein
LRPEACGHLAIVVDTSINEAATSEPGGAREGEHPAPPPSRAWWRRLRWPRPTLSDAWCFGVCYVVLLPFFLAPLFATPLLPGLDLPFHLAAADMLAKAGNPGSPYAPYYEGGLRIAPYAAHFIALFVLGKVMGLLAAHKLIIVLYVGGLPLAMASLLGACRRSRIPALLAFPLAYNLTLHYGFVSFALSLPVVLLVLSETTKLVGSEQRRILVVRWFVTAGLLFLLFLCHLQNFLYGVCAVLAFAALAAAPIRRRLLGAAALVPAFAALAYWHLRSPPVTGQSRLTFALAWRFLRSHRLEDLGGGGLLNNLWYRVTLIPSHALRGFVDESNVPACRGLCLIMVAYVGVGLLAWSPPEAPADHRSARKRRMRLASAIAFLGALTAYLALPHHLQELELMTFFPRFSVLVLLMFLLLVPAGLLRLRGRLLLALPVPALVFGVLYGRLLYTHYRAYGEEVAGFVEVARKTPPGGKALGLVFDKRSKVMQVESALVGLPGFYPALRPALGSMVPPAYCGLRHMPCRRRTVAEFATSPWSPHLFVAAKMLPTFDYYFVRSAPLGLDPWRGYHNMFELVAVSGTWAVFRKRPGPVVPDPPPPAAAPAVVPKAVPAAPAVVPKPVPAAPAVVPKPVPAAPAVVPKAVPAAPAVVPKPLPPAPPSGKLTPPARPARKEKPWRDTEGSRP